MHLYRFIPCMVFVAACTDALPAAEHDQSIDGQVLRVVAGNITGQGQRYDDGAGIRIFQGLHPDVALVQETNYSAGVRAFVDEAFGPEFEYVVGSGRIPNSVVSRFPLIDSGEWTDPFVGDRAFTWAHIDLPGANDLWAISVHLLTSSAGNRNNEAHEIMEQIEAAVPNGDWIVIGGDFNTKSRGEAALSTLSGRFETSGPYPVDLHDDGDTNASRNKPYDWVLASNELHTRETPVLIGDNSFSHGFVGDTRAYSPISDLSPAESGDSGAFEMQHMAIVRDFDIPNETTSSVHVSAPNGGETWEVDSMQNIRWSATNVDSVDIEYAANGSSFTRIASDVPASPGSFAWTVPGPETTTGRIRIIGNKGGADDDSDAAFEVGDGGTTTPGAVIVNEVLINEPGSATTGEFIELVNIGSTAVDLAGWTLADAVSVRHQFGATSLAPGARVVITGSTASTGTLGLSNSGDTVKLGNAQGGAVDSVTLGSSPDGVSFNRSPDATTGSFVLHTELSAQSSSPGGAP